ncbi:putative hydrolase of the HAD superfamily [Paenibacillaceae bacterium GAS479]|nr:putative hydrolase of the HAD superfamily [Paenibacillaceae bacterium GAS479]
MIKAVLFDLFETLITEFSDGKRLSKRDYDYQALLGLSDEEFHKEWRSRSKDRMTGRFPDYPSVIKDIITKRELKCNDQSIQHLYQKRMEEKMIPFRNIGPEVIHLLTSLKNNKLKLGLVSNCTEEEISEWRHSELAPYFDEVIFSYEVGFAKPDPRIYELACHRLKVESSEAIFIGDGGSQELEGAHGAGLMAYQAVWFSSFIDSKFKKLVNPSDVLSSDLFSS